VCFHIRVARWLIIIQEYDIELEDIREVENHLADILSRNPAGLEVNEIQDLTKSNKISVYKKDLKIDKTVLKNLANKEKNDPRLRIIRQKTKIDPANMHRIEEDVLFRRY